MSNQNTNRRDLLKSGAAITAGTVAASLATRANAQGDGTIKVGLVGAGGRGSGAAAQALTADSGAKLVALADLFPDRAAGAAGNIKKQKPNQVDLPPDRVYSGFDAYKKVIDQVDVVLLTTPPGYRPVHLEYAVERGVHVFAEKPVASDAAGLRRCLAAARKGKEKGLNIVSGLCYRYEKKKQQLIEQIHGGAIGEIVSAETNYRTGGLWYRGNKPEWSPMELQNRNWYYYTWLSGDHIAEQHVHSLDKIAWAFDEYPTSAISTGGRIQRTDAKYGDIYDHFSTTFTYASGRVAYSCCRQWAGAAGGVSDTVHGTLGTAEIQGHAIKFREKGKDAFRVRLERGVKDNMYQNEHDELFKALRTGKPIYNGDYMCNSTMMAVMARMSAYTGQRVTWEQAWNSKEDLVPATLDWGPAPEVSVKIPGRTKLV